MNQLLQEEISPPKKKLPFSYAANLHLSVLLKRAP